MDDFENKPETVNKNVKTIDSREVAEMMGKEHKDLLDYINGKIDKNGNVKIVGIKEILEKEHVPFNNYFIESSYKPDGAKRSYQCYLCTKMGCELLGNKQKGEKGILFTAKYVKRFNEMEQIIEQPKVLSPMEQLRLQYQVLEEHDKKLEIMEKKVEIAENNTITNGKKIAELEANLPLLGVDCEELVKEVKKTGVKYLGYGTPAYKDKSTRMKVYTDIYGQIKREFGVNSYKALKRIQLSKALEFIKSYKLPTILAEKIAALNSQVSMEV